MIASRNTPRLGLCCQFRQAPIEFRTRQATHILKHDRDRQLALLSATVLANCRALREAVSFCDARGIGSFRVNSQFLPLKTHPAAGYRIEQLPEFKEILDLLAAVRTAAAAHDLRLTFHPDQFTLLSSPRAEVTRNSIEELAYHAELADLIGADVITIHGGGAYGDKKTALRRLTGVIRELDPAIRSKLVLENDDRTYTPEDLLPVCEATATPLVYDVHHHRCLPDRLTVELATELALVTWDREPLFHLSSPKAGWTGADPKPHDDLIDPRDFPRCWCGREITVEVEAKAKEVAVERLLSDLGRRCGEG